MKKQTLRQSVLALSSLCVLGLSQAQSVVAESTTAVTPSGDVGWTTLTPMVAPEAKATVLFEHQMKATQTISNIGLAYTIELKRDGHTFNVDNRFQFRSGDRIRFHVKPNINGYLYISLADQNGDSQLLFPSENTADNQNQVIKGEDVTVPRKGVLTFDDRAGVEALTIVLSPKPMKSQFVKSERRVTVNPKTGTFTVPTDYSVNINPLNESGETSAQEYNSRDPLKKPAITVVNNNTQLPLVMDLFLKHEPKEAKISLTAATDPPDKNLLSTADTGIDRTVFSKGPLGESRDKPVTDKWAVVIGVSKFKMPALNLRYPDKDAHDMADFLIKHAHFAPDHVKIVTDAQATRNEIISNLGSKWLPHNAKPDDMVFIYMATHGAADEFDKEHKNYIVAYDTDPFHLPATGIELNEFAKNVVGKIPCERVVMILDTCYAGAALRPGAKSIFDVSSFALDTLMQGTGHLVIGSASRQQSAHDSLRYPNGIFTKQLIDGLQKYPKLSDAFRYAKVHVEEESICDFGKPQTPVIKDSDWKGAELRLAVPPVAPRKPVE